MNKSLKTSLALGLILSLILCAALLAACDPKEDPQPQPKTETYTVNVTCEDSAALENVKVQIKDANGEKADEKDLENGKAVFELVPANYTATLSGIGEDYSFEDGTLSATDKECTIEVLHINIYTVNINYKTSKDVFGNTVTQGGPAEGVTVSLYVGQLKDDNLSKLDKPPVLAATAQTDATGKAIFKLSGEMYTVVVSGLAAGQSINYRVGTDPKNWVTAYTVSTSSPKLDLPLNEPTLLGKDTKNTIPLKLGENDVPLSRNVFMELDYPGVFFVFTPEESGEYTFTTTSNAKIIDGEGFSIYNEPTILIDGAGSFVLSLEKGKPHMLVCTANNEASLAYTLTIEKSA